MPTLSVEKNLLMQHLGNYSDDEFGELCFQFGIELDDIVAEKEIVYKIDIPANRYDLLSTEGLVIALKIFTGKIEPPEYTVKPSGLQFDYVGEDVQLAAVVRNLKLTQDFFDLLEKINNNLGRKKKLVSITTQDLDGEEPVSLQTKNILIKVTSSDREKATIALDTLVTMLISSNGSYEAESVQVNNLVSPNLDYKREKISVSYINQGLGLNLTAAEIAKLLVKMALRATVLPGDEDIEVQIPPTRHDIIHKCDVMEDVGIAFGYDNIPKTLPKRATIATQVPINKLSDQLRHEVARCGYTEALNFALCSEDDLSTKLRSPQPANLVKIQNPKTTDFQVGRSCLLVGLLKTLQANRKMPLPMKLFEIGDIIISDPSKDVGARNERHLAAIYLGKQTSGFEVIHGLLDRVMQVLDITGYHIQASEENVFLPGRSAAVMYDGRRIGHIGILHPHVLTNFELHRPASALEINVLEYVSKSDS